MSLSNHNLIYSRYILYFEGHDLVWEECFLRFSLNNHISIIVYRIPCYLYFSIKDCMVLTVVLRNLEPLSFIAHKVGSVEPLHDVEFDMAVALSYI